MRVLERLVKLLSTAWALCSPPELNPLGSADLSFAQLAMHTIP
jgi:hypothetical protein